MCEKPCGIDVAETEVQLAACNEAGVQFMDGVMFMHSKRLDALRETLTDGSIGKVRRIHWRSALMAATILSPATSACTVTSSRSVAWAISVGTTSGLISGPWNTPCPRP